MGLLELPLDDLYRALETTTVALEQHLTELAQARIAENDTRLQTWMQTPAETQKHRDLLADSAAASFKAEIFTMLGECDADRARIDLLKMLIARAGGKIP